MSISIIFTNRLFHLYVFFIVACTIIVSFFLAKQKNTALEDFIWETCYYAVML